MNTVKERLSRFERSPASLGATAVVVALTLLLLQALLSVPGGWGIEDFLGSAHAHPTLKPFNYDRGSIRAVFVALYFAADSLLFVPAYAAFALSVIAALVGGSRRPPDPSAGWLLRAPVLALVLADLTENALGLVRVFDGHGVALAVVTSGIALLLLGRLHEVRSALRHWPQLGLGAAAGIMSTLVLIGALRSDGDATLFARVAVGAHAAKRWLGVTAIALLSLAVLAWLFGVDRFSLPTAERASHRQVSQDRTRLRTGIADMIRRSRYVLFALAVVAGLTGFMDQARDLLYAMAASPFSRALDGASEPPRVWAWLGSMVSLGALALATGALEYTCWLWTRSVCQIRPARDEPIPKATRPVADEVPTSPPTTWLNSFAKYWARSLAFIPIACLVYLHARVIGDGVVAGGAQPGHHMGPVYTVLGFGGGVIALGVWLLQRHSDPKAAETDCYYSARDWADWARWIGLGRDRKSDEVLDKYLIVFKQLKLYWLPILLGVGLLLLRATDVLPADWPWQKDYVPSLALAIMLMSVALWLCFFGWLSVLEVQQSVPWVALLVIVVGALGAFGVTDNHVVWSAIEPLPPERAAQQASLAGLRMLWFTFLFLACALSADAGLLYVARQRLPGVRVAAQGHSGWRAAVAGLGLGALIIGVIIWADHSATSRRFAHSGVLPASERPTLDAALAGWLQRLYISHSNKDPFPVYFISTEGGGIRAAAWTAFALAHQARDPSFLERTFSISGVSGGAVGAAAFRACSLQGKDADGADDLEKCLQHFAETDMLSPLTSAWLFEDVLARVLPTRWCKTPGCGVLSRGAWFEQALENGAPGLRQGLIETSGWHAAAHTPYLLLNSTWVETGERAIASDLSVSWQAFPNAKDQLAIVGSDLPLETAAHNAARFPFINPIGSLHATETGCADRAPESPSKSEPCVANPTTPCPPKKEQLQTRACGHLADGGYFDNSGAQTTLDALRGFEACLTEPRDPPDPDAAAYPECRKLDSAQRTWFRTHLVPQIWMIRNNIEPELACPDVCAFDHDRPDPTRATIVDEPLMRCPTETADSYHPDRPICRAPSDTFVGLVGPALTILNVSGIGPARRVAETRQMGEVRALRGRLNLKTDLPAVRAIDLMPDGVLYPLGWHLSALASEGMWRQAECYRRD